MFGCLGIFGRLGPWVLLGAFFFIVGAVLVLLGFDLDAVDRWFERQSWIEIVASLLFRAVCGFVLLICVVVVIAAIFDRKNPERPPLGCLLLALPVGYFAWIGMTMPA